MECQGYLKETNIYFDRFFEIFCVPLIKEQDFVSFAKFSLEFHISVFKKPLFNQSQNFSRFEDNQNARNEGQLIGLATFFLYLEFK